MAIVTTSLSCTAVIELWLYKREKNSEREFHAEKFLTSRWLPKELHNSKAKRARAQHHTHPRKFGMAWPHTPNYRPFTPQENQCLILHFLVSLGAQEQPDIALIFNINVEINWQLSKQGIRWPVSPDRMAGSGIEPSRSSIVLKLSADRLLLFKWSQAKVHFFLIHMK